MVIDKKTVIGIMSKVFYVLMLLYLGMFIYKGDTFHLKIFLIFFFIGVYAVIAELIKDIGILEVNDKIHQNDLLTISKRIEIYETSIEMLKTRVHNLEYGGESKYESQIKN